MNAGRGRQLLRIEIRAAAGQLIAGSAPRERANCNLGICGLCRSPVARRLIRIRRGLALRTAPAVHRQRARTRAGVAACRTAAAPAGMVR